MSVDTEKIKALVAFKKKLEDMIEKLESEQSDLKNTLEMVTSILLDKGFKRGDIKEVNLEANSSGATPTPVEPKIPREEKPIAQRAESESVIPLRTAHEEPLAIIYVNRDSLHVLPDESKNFSVNTPPFGNFLVERVFAKMQDKDNELVRAGQLPQDKMFSYTIVREGELIREIIIKNVDEERLRELKSSIRWTLEKMYEKMRG